LAKGIKGRGKYATLGISGFFFTPTLALLHQGGGEFKVVGQPQRSELIRDEMKYFVINRNTEAGGYDDERQRRNCEVSL
jgi:hypothetical protein